MSNNEDFCANANDMEEYDEFDYMLLFRALDSVRVTTKEYLEKEKDGGASENFRKSTFVKCKRQFSFYTCKIKPEIQQNKENKKLMTTIFGLIIFFGSSYYTYWLMKQLWKGLSGEKHNIPIFYALIYIVLFNPIFSFITVSMNIVKFRAKSYMDKGKKDSIEEIEDKIKFALSCDDNFNIDSACSYYKYFDNEKESLCKSLKCKEECKDIVENSPLNKDVIASKIEKLDFVHQFFVNQKKFILKVNNPTIEIKQNIYIDNAIDFLLGSRVKDLISENIENSDETLAYLTNVGDIRNNIENIVRLSEGYMYDEIGKISNYSEYFEVQLNEEINQIILEIMKFFSSHNNVIDYFTKNEFINTDYQTIDNLVLHIDNYNPNSKIYESISEKSSNSLSSSLDNGEPEKILEIFYSIMIKLRRLNISWLPEYVFLKDLLFNETNPKIDEGVQRALYKASNVDELKPSFKKILAIFINNTNYFEISPTDDNLNTLMLQYDNIGNELSNLIVLKDDKTVFDQQDFEAYVTFPLTSVVIQTSPTTQNPEIESANPVVETKKIRHLRNVFRLSIDSITGDSYMWHTNMPKDEYNGDSLVFKKCKTFIYSLKNKSLDANFTQKFKVEAMLIKNVLSEYLDNVKIPKNKIVNYIDTYLLRNNPIPGDDRKKTIFKGNVKKLFDFTIKKSIQEGINANIYYNAKDNIEFPNRYITFEEFNVKLLNIEKGQFLKYSTNVHDVSKDVTYFIDKIEELNNKMEQKQEMSRFYMQYAYIYIISSFFYLMNVCYETFFDESIDFIIFDKKITDTDKGKNSQSATKTKETDEKISKEEFENELLTEKKYEKLVKVALFASVWMLSCVIIFTYNNKNATIVGYNRIMSNINTKKLETHMQKLDKVILEYSEKSFPSESLDSNVMDSTDSNSGISKTKKTMYIDLIRAIELYDKCNYIHQNADSTPFPWTEIMISGIILLIMITLIVVSNFQNNPFKKLNIEEDKYSLLKVVEDTLKIDQTGGALPGIDLSLDDAAQKQLEKITSLETMLATRISFFKSDSTFNYVSVSFCIFVFSFYIGYNMLISNINFKNNLYSGNLYIRSRCYQ